MSIEDEIRKLNENISKNIRNQNKEEPEKECETDLAIRAINYRIFAEVQLNFATMDEDIEKTMFWQCIIDNMDIFIKYKQYESSILFYELRIRCIQNNPVIHY
jgi:hypothetical protein